VVGLDANLLISAYAPSDSYHRESRALIDDLARSGSPFALFWPALYAFLRVVTHHRIFSPPASSQEALTFLDRLVSHPSTRLLAETDRHHEILGRILKGTGVTGSLVSDAHLVALAIEHGVDEILTFDGDFARFPQVRSRHPFRK
jgi:toxin-antitoxin system PIN domain toxin